MLELSILPLFAMTCLLLAISPGPDLVLISAYSSGQGFLAGVRISLGIFIAGLLQTLGVALGLGQLMQQFPPLIMLVKLLGALYLAWLGVNMLKTWWINKKQTQASVKATPLSSRNLLIKGFLNNLMNPKAILFFSVFLVQFTNDTQPMVPQIITLGVLLCTIVLLVNFAFSIIFSKVASIFAGKFKLAQHFDGILGTLFLALAARLALSKEH
ncbi:LysE family translocator [Pseudoalteromonas sp. Of7M-16]|uniref:LysE family translocator n=1 Tax=Pseudoalteromonas sp. Of7M-16 TaxID=2917756 RepID=UPI001EF5331A|nr:LysE family translocator [Pseudoalteromonas sp. Of7M-16]MCG7548119.1 LysE family translocator [Pseudoalteromonas sp. Of7M-16]